MKAAVLLLLLGFAAGSVCANDSSLNVGAYGPSPVGGVKEGESVVRMVAERIEMVMGRTESRVHCRFTFRSNKPKADARQIVGFPDDATLDPESDHGRILRMKTLVDGVEVESKKQAGWMMQEPPFEGGLMETLPSGMTAASLAEREGPYLPVQWYTVPVTFPPNRDVVIERIYTVENGGSVLGDHWFQYTTRTGAVWRGTIGEAVFDVKLEGLTVEDLAFEDGPQKRPAEEQFTYCVPNRAEWKIESPTHLTLRWQDFEPRVHKTRRGILLATWTKPQKKE